MALTTHTQEALDAAKARLCLAGCAHSTASYRVLRLYRDQSTGKLQYDEHDMGDADAGCRAGLLPLQSTATDCPYFTPMSAEEKHGD